ncbi:MAG: Xaa-Pro peptidase family protein [Actinomycetota bacterium]
MTSLVAQSLPPVDVADREHRARAAVAAAGVEALVVTGLSNARWLTGFAGSNATVLITADELVLYTDSRYADRAPVELGAVGSSARVVIARADLGDRVAEELEGTTRVGLEAEYLTWARQRSIATSWLPGRELIATEEVLDRVRAVKDDAELARIEAAAAIVDGALAATVPMFTQRPTEREFAVALEARIRSDASAIHGATGVETDIGFDTIVASGPNGAIPHHAPGERTIDRGDLVIVDVGGRIDGYRSDMTRTFSVGPMSTDQARHYDTVIAAQQAGVEAMTVGAETNTVDAAARQVIEDAGWGDAFVHGTGHGVGLDIHELPRVSAISGSDDRYEAGTVATVEPGVYLRGVAGVRIEDTCVATAEGARRLTGYPKDPELGS